MRPTGNCVCECAESRLISGLFMFLSPSNPFPLPPPAENTVTLFINTWWNMLVGEVSTEKAPKRRYRRPIGNSPGDPRAPIAIPPSPWPFLNPCLLCRQPAKRTQSHLLARKKQRNTSCGKHKMVAPLQFVRLRPIAPSSTITNPAVFFWQLSFRGLLGDTCWRWCPKCIATIAASIFNSRGARALRKASCAAAQN